RALDHLDLYKLGSSPYAPVFTSDVRLDASDVDLHIAEFGLVYCLPSVSSYVGADIVAGLIATALYRSDERSLLIDIGTNGEIVLGSRDGLFACSCAAGPAFEGMNISSGMRASAGAVERVDIDGDVSVRTVGDKPPIGLCGSGVIDAVAELIKVEVIERSGRLMKPTRGNGPGKWSDRFLTDNGLRRFVICDGDRTGGTVAITQRDVRQVQLAKGAIRSGVLALMNRLDLDLNDVDHIYIAGAFGRHVRLESLARLGVFPESYLDKVELIGNSSKSGALLCLLSQSKRREASRVAEQVTYVELSCYPEYDRLFAECLAFPG
ncbi:MAG: ASKHA domain-containing protein, partial [Chloroflexi bacterium]|nr:ASKHA domain-containing protein [Chloroflexota bacterium]